MLLVHVHVGYMFVQVKVWPVNRSYHLLQDASDNHGYYPSSGPDTHGYVGENVAKINAFIV